MGFRFLRCFQSDFCFSLVASLIFFCSNFDKSVHVEVLARFFDYREINFLLLDICINLYETQVLFVVDNHFIASCSMFVTAYDLT